MYFIFFLIATVCFNIVVGLGIWPYFSNAYIKLLLEIFEYTHLTLSEAKLSKNKGQNALHMLQENCSQENVHDMAIENREEEYPQQQQRQEQEQQQQQLQQNPKLDDDDNNEEKQLNDPEIMTCHSSIEDLCKLLGRGFHSILKDKVTKCFVAEKPICWNLLTRHLVDYHHLTWKLKALWILGVLIRYIILLPARFVLCCASVICMAVISAILGQLPHTKWKRQLIDTVMRFCFRFMACSVSAAIRFHNTENRPKNGICVANHTTPMDVLMLMCDTNYSLIGQGHGGFLGLLQMLLKCVSPHMWFERAEAHDRQEVSAMMRKHIAVPDNPPILIFPEGTCINNTCVVKFRKGCFEVSEVIAPIAIKYDRRFCEAFWDSTRYSILHYIFLMISSWSIVCDIWYLPTMKRNVNETSIQFANRVKAAIARKANLANHDWDGNLKRYNPPWNWSLFNGMKFP